MCIDTYKSIDRVFVTFSSIVEE